ncbi:aldo/keto reductase [Mycolicibacterium komossense]|uniref:Aldo/keto reductase n=1 Tax=Mycolicibacterium komossense TaxID=1779 RepID=A0ABT3CEQ2_9MYCO|nr:aldo/keto reductase [Mycolicibacterium komossense]MCV7227963.1 aldo/keto reductase [Mycolicibacterium komossense]
MSLSPADKLGLGLAAVGRPAYLTGGRDADLGGARSVSEMRARTLDILNTAYDNGIRYIDTARSYGLAEEFLADWLRVRPEATDVVVASKWGYRYVGDWRLDVDVHEVKEHTLEAFEQQWHESQTLLGGRLSLYQVHSVTEDSPLLRDERLQRALADLRSSGLAVGFSTSGPRQAATIRAALTLRVDGAPLFDSVQSTWNLLETSAAPALAEAHAAGVTVILKECFANGRLAPAAQDPAPGLHNAVRTAADLGVGVDQLAIAAAAHQPWATRVLSGAATADQVRSHVAGVALELTPAQLADLTGRAEEPDEYWAARSRRAWN